MFSSYAQDPVQRRFVEKSSDIPNPRERTSKAGQSSKRIVKGSRMKK
jgi:hypothetical protein